MSKDTLKHSKIEAEMVDAIRKAVHEFDGKVTVCEAIGALEAVKMEVWNKAESQTDEK